MTDEEIYLKVREHFSNPANPWGYALIPSKTVPGEMIGQCVYRGPNGEKCSIGVCLTDEDYEPEMEGRSVSFLWHDFRLFQDNDERFLTEMQNKHDSSAGYAMNGKTSDYSARGYFIGWLDSQAFVRGWNVPV